MQPPSTTSIDKPEQKKYKQLLVGYPQGNMPYLCYYKEHNSRKKKSISKNGGAMQSMLHHWEREEWYEPKADGGEGSA